MFENLKRTISRTMATTMANRSSLSLWIIDLNRASDEHQYVTSRVTQIGANSPWVVQIEAS